MKLTRDFGLKLLGAFAVVALIAWVVMSTEWADVYVDTPPRGEAARDPTYASKQIVRRLAAKVVAPRNLDAMPPPGATLVLSSFHWNLFAGRSERLQRWVESGGHLLVDDLILSDGPLSKWVPVRRASAAEAIIRRPARPSGPAAPSPICKTLQEAGTAAPAFGTARSYLICLPSRQRLRPTASAALWALGEPDAYDFLRVPVGGGTVTVIPSSSLLRQPAIFEGDDALALVAALQLQAASEVWFVTTEARAPLLAQIWSFGAPAVLIGAMALGLALWRGATRFGPRAPNVPLARRSVAEQIRGTSAFILQHGGAALYRAQLRALEDAARRCIPNHDKLGFRDRARAIADAARLDADALTRAMEPSLERTRRDLPATLALLESARRSMTHGRSASGTPPHPPSTGSGR